MKQFIHFAVIVLNKKKLRNKFSSHNFDNFAESHAKWYWNHERFWCCGVFSQHGNSGSAGTSQSTPMFGLRLRRRGA